MDCLAGRKTAGRTTGDVRVNGHPQLFSTFARVSGYCEQASHPPPLPSMPSRPGSGPAQLLLPKIEIASAAGIPPQLWSAWTVPTASD